jgi:hypothetical protein
MTPKDAPPETKQIRIWVNVPEALSPTARYKKYEEPIDAELAKRGVGRVTGGGTKLIGDRVEHCYIDIAVTDAEGRVQLVKDLLRALGAPRGTTITIELDDRDQTASVWD